MKKLYIVVFSLFFSTFAYAENITSEMNIISTGNMQNEQVETMSWVVTQNGNIEMKIQSQSLQTTQNSNSIIQPLDPAIIQERFDDLLLELWDKYDDKGVVKSLKSLSKLLESYKDINSVYLNDLVKAKILELDIPEKKEPKIEEPKIVSKSLDKVVVINNNIQWNKPSTTSLITWNDENIPYTAPNWKKYTFKKLWDWYVYETSTKKLSFKYKQELIDYINLYNPKEKSSQELNAPVKSNNIPSIIHITPNWKSQAIQKLLNGYIIKDKKWTKLFDTLEKAKEYLDKNNK